MGVKNKLGIGKVADTGYNRKREREDARGLPERAGVHTLPGTCVEKIGGDIVEGYREPMHATCRE